MFFYIRNQRVGFRRIIVKKKEVLFTLFGLMSVLVINSNAYSIEKNVFFDGELVAEPCTLDPETTKFTLELGDIVDRYIYINTRTHSKQFNIKLLNCDTKLGQSVIVTFKGIPDSELTDLLSISSGTARGIAVGLEYSNGASLPLNTATPAYKLTKGGNILNFNAYVQGKPKAIQNHAILKGSFSAVSTFTLEYP